MNGNLYCDNYGWCNSYVFDQGELSRTENRARARGWHIYHGQDHSGNAHHAVLCGHCVDAKRRDLKPAPDAQPGQETLFEVEVINEWNEAP